MEVLCLYLLVRQNISSIKHSQLWDMEEDLRPIVFFILDWIVAEIKLSQERKQFDKLQLKDFLDAIQRKIEETQCANGL